MKNNNYYTVAQIEKLGNTIIYLSERIKPLYKTKLLKLIYLIEELSIKEYGIPFFYFDFKVWKLGPVVRDIYVELSSPSFLSKFIKIKNGTEDKITIVPKRPFCDDEFSDIDISLLDLIIKSYKYKTSLELIELTHRKHLPWYITAKQNGLIEIFNNNLSNSSDYNIDMSILLDDQPKIKQFYFSNVSNYIDSKNLKNNL